MEAEPLDLYKEQVKNGVFSSLPYDRLMIHFRKEKNYAEELKVIKKAITTFKNYYTKPQRSSIKKQKNEIAELSRKFSRSTGLTDKKGNEVFLPEPIPKWINRQAVVEKKLKGKKK